MDLGGREILIALGALLLLAILLDGFRRMRSAGRGKLRVKRRRQPIFDDDGFDEFGSELPSGKARVVGFRDEDSAEQLSLTIKASRESDDSRLTAPFRQPEGKKHPEQASMGFTEDTSDFTESALSDDRISTQMYSQTNSASELGDDSKAKLKKKSGRESQTSLFTDPLSEAENNSGVTNNEDHNTVNAPDKTSKNNHQSTSGKAKVTNKKSSRAKLTAKEESAKESSTPDDVVVLHLMAQKDQVFRGDDLLKAVVDNGLRYGAQKIFHRHVREDGSGDILFSMANSVNPGTFELNSMGEFSTPGVTFMMMLEDSEDPLATFDLMLESIHGINTAIDGELKDQQRSALSRQTAEHYRQQIMDFNRRRLATGG